MKFLQHIADIYANNPNLMDTTFIFPNRRAGLFFKRELLNRTKKTTFAPKITDINSFTESLSTLHKVNDIQLLISLYQAYTEVRAKHTDKLDSLETFIPFGLTLLADFNEIDKYLVDTRLLFTNVSDLKKINDQSQIFDDKQIEILKTFWHNITINTEENLSFKQEFISLWDDLHEIYTIFTQNLIDQNIAYEGLIYRNLVENIATIQPQKSTEIYCFVGFNHLTPSEYQIFKHFQKIGATDFYFDYPTTYATSPLASSVAKYYEQNLREFPSRNKYNQPTEQNIPNISVHSTPSTTNQINIVSTILNYKSFNTPEKTAILLADESLMPSLIQQLPNNIKKINITMGYPLSLTPVASLINHLLYLQTETTTNQQGEIQFYHKPLLSVLSHQNIQSIYPNTTSLIIKQITRNNYIRITQKQLHKIIGELEIIDEEKLFFTALFTTYTTSDDLLNYLNRTITYIINNHTELSNPIDIEYLYQYQQVLNQLTRLLTLQLTDITPQSILQLIQRLTSSLKVQFKGEPIEGLQIMGLLESRLLDFDNIIFVGFNDAKIPGNKSLNSIIPYNLRRAYNLPTYETTDAIQAYNFYRTLYYSKNIHFVYDSRTEGTQNEISRYYYQLKYLLDAPIKHYNYTQQIANNSDITSDTQLEITNNLALSKLLSASSIKNYITCPLQFYFSTIVGIKQPNQINELGEPSLLGNIYHKAMELYYKTYKTPTKINNLHQIINKAFEEESKKSKKQISTTGFNSLIFNLVLHFVEDTIKFDIQRYKQQPFSDIKSEVKIEKKIANVDFIAYIDRIDKTGNIVNIIDYKTTSAKIDTKINIVDLFTSPHSGYHEVFQIILYCYLYKLENPTDIIRPILYKIHSLKTQTELQTITLLIPNELNDPNNLPNVDIDLKEIDVDKKNCSSVEITDYDLISAPFEWLLNKTLYDIQNQSQPFTTNSFYSKENTCKYCQFKTLCNISLSKK